MEKCPHHSGHEARIETVEQAQKDHDKDSKEVRARLFDAIDRLQTQYLNKILERPPLWATALITILSSLTVGLIVAFIMLLCK